jgi:hypothetical protein
MPYSTTRKFHKLLTSSMKFEVLIVVWLKISVFQDKTLPVGE